MTTDLTQTDIDTLQSYSSVGNYAGYYGYLIAKGDDYATLAFGVAEGNSRDGAAARQFAQNYTLISGGGNISGAEWATLATNLMQADFDARASAFSDNASALNLDYQTIRDYHVAAFTVAGLPKEAWTLYIPQETGSLTSAQKQANWENFTGDSHSDAHEFLNGVGLTAGAYDSLVDALNNEDGVTAGLLESWFSAMIGNHETRGAISAFLSGQAAIDPYVISVNGHQVFGGSSDDDVMVQNSQTSALIIGYSGDDRIYGSDLADTIFAGDDNDTIVGSSGDDIMNGGDGIDTVSYDGQSREVRVNLSDNTVFIDGLATDSYQHIFNVENVIGGSGNDGIWSNDLDNDLNGGTGTDAIIFKGDFGNDKVTGGETIHSGDTYLMGTAVADSYGVYHLGGATYQQTTSGLLITDANGPTHGTILLTDWSTTNDYNISFYPQTATSGNDVMTANAANYASLNPGAGGGDVVLINSGLPGTAHITDAEKIAIDGAAIGGHFINDGADKYHQGNTFLEQTTNGMLVTKGTATVLLEDFDSVTNNYGITLDAAATGSGTNGGYDASLGQYVYAWVKIQVDFDYTVAESYATNRDLSWATTFQDAWYDHLHNVIHSAADDTTRSIGDVALDVFYQNGNFSSANYFTYQAAALTWDEGHVYWEANQLGYANTLGTVVDIVSNANFYPGDDMQGPIISTHISNAIFPEGGIDMETYAYRWVAAYALIRDANNDGYDDYGSIATGGSVYSDLDDDDIVWGGTANDTMIGSNGNDILYGDEGNDRYELYGNIGDTVIDDSDGDGSIDVNGTVLGRGFNGEDSLHAATWVAADTWELDGHGITLNGSTLRITTEGTITVENFTNGDLGIILGGMSFTGTAYDDTINGSVGDDTIDGEDGDDLISSSAAADSIDGGDGIDTISYATATAAVFADIGSGNPWLFYGDTTKDTLTNIENITGTAYDDSIAGNAEANILIGGLGSDTIFGMGGNDTIDSGADTFDGIDAGDGDDLILSGGAGDYIEGGAGNDTVSYAAMTAAIEVSLAAYTANGDTLLHVENLIGTGYDDTISGDSGDNRLEGGAGDDIIAGGAGTDTLLGGSGADIFTIADSATATIISDFLHGTDQIDLLDFTDASVFGDLTITQDGDNAIVTVAHNGSGDVAITLTGVIASTLDADDFILHGILGYIEGTSASETLTGGSGNDTINALAGDDTIASGGGHDTIDGGDGIDTVTYAAASAAIFADVGSGNPWLFYGSTTNDSLTHIENITGSDYDDSIAGNSDANVLTGGLGSDTIFGMGGNDTIDAGSASYDGIDAGDGNDLILSGGAGDYVNGGAGNDTVSYAGATSAIEVSLSSYTTNGDTLLNVENLTGTGYADTITGNTAANILDGGAGADLLTGGSGVDTLIGGLGADHFIFSADTDSGLGGGYRDVISDFADGSDKIDLSGFSGSFTFLGTGSFTGTANEVSYAVASGNTVVSVDSNGDGTGDLQIELVGSYTLAGTDFIL